MVSVREFNFDDPSSYPAKVYIFFGKNAKINRVVSFSSVTLDAYKH